MEADVFKLLQFNQPTTCLLDPNASNLLQVISPTLPPALTDIINTSLLTTLSLATFKQAEKLTLNYTLVENYRPVSFLLFPSI